MFQRFRVVVFPQLLKLVGLSTSKVRKKANIRNRYIQVLQVTRDTIWESDKNTRKHHTQENRGISPFQAGDHKAARNRQDSITKKISKRIHKRSPALKRSVKTLLEGLIMFSSINHTLNCDVDQDTLMFDSHERSLTYRYIIY